MSPSERAKSERIKQLQFAPSDQGKRPALSRAKLRANTDAFKNSEHATLSLVTFIDC